MESFIPLWEWDLPKKKSKKRKEKEGESSEKPSKPKKAGEKAAVEMLSTIDRSSALPHPRSATIEEVEDDGS